MIFNFKDTTDAKTLDGHSADYFLSKTGTASNSEKLGGHEPSYFAEKTDLANYLPLTGGGDVTGKVNFKASYAAPVTVDRLANGSTPWLAFLSNGVHNGQVGVSADGKLVFMGKSDNSARDVLHTGNMTTHVLPLNGGGTVQKNGAIPIALQNTEGSTTLIQFYGKDGNLGYLGISTANTPIFRTTDGTYKDLLHTGNSVKTVISNTAPTDTTALWVDTSA